MRIEESVARIQEAGLVVVVRGVGPEALEPTAGALEEGGVVCLEIAVSVRGALRQIAGLKAALGDHVLVGAGEVLNSEMALLAASSRADFCSGPAVNSEMIAFCNQRDLLGIPGALTPTEIQRAWHCGAPLIKLFPADVFGPSYLATVHRPFPGVALMPSGNITPDNAAAFLQRGAVAVCAGSSVVDPAAISSGDYATVARRAAALVAAVQAARA